MGGPHKAMDTCTAGCCEDVPLPLRHVVMRLRSLTADAAALAQGRILVSRWGYYSEDYVRRQGPAQFTVAASSRPAYFPTGQGAGSYSTRRHPLTRIKPCATPVVSTTDTGETHMGRQIYTVGGLDSFVQGTIWPKLKEVGFEPVDHIAYDKKTPDPSFNAGALVVILVDMIGHAKAEKIRAAAQRQGVEWVYGERKWVGLTRALERQGALVEGKAVDGPKGPRVFAQQTPEAIEPTSEDDVLLSLNTPQLRAYLIKQPWTRTPRLDDTGLRSRTSDRFYDARSGAGIIMAHKGSTIPARVHYPTWMKAAEQMGIPTSPLPALEDHGMQWVDAPGLDAVPVLDAAALAAALPMEERFARIDVPAWKSDPEPVKAEPTEVEEPTKAPPAAPQPVPVAPQPAPVVEAPPTLPKPSTGLQAAVALLLEEARKADFVGTLTLDLATGKLSGKRRRVIVIEEDAEIEG